jgi:hypothetical protein
VRAETLDTLAVQLSQHLAFFPATAIPLRIFEDTQGSKVEHPSFPDLLPATESSELICGLVRGLGGRSDRNHLFPLPGIRTIATTGLCTLQAVLAVPAVLDAVYALRTKATRLASAPPQRLHNPPLAD